MTRPRWVRRVVGHSIPCCALAFFVLGCGSNYQNYREGFVRSGITGDTAALKFDTKSEELVANTAAAPDHAPPVWVSEGPGALPADADNYYFVGRSIAYDVLDERSAYDQARDHVLQQIGKMVATRVGARDNFGDVRSTARGRYLPGEAGANSLEDNMRLTTDSIAGDLVERKVYWEQWYLEEKPEDYTGWPWKPYNNRIKRYKVWVLMSIPKTSVDKFFNETRHAPGQQLLGPRGFRLVAG